MPVYSVTVRNRAAALVLTLAILGAGAALLVLGLALLAALSVAGGVMAVGVLAYRALRGGARQPGAVGRVGAMELDPSLEVFPDNRAIGERRDPSAPGDALPPGDG